MKYSNYTPKPGIRRALKESGRSFDVYIGDGAVLLHRPRRCLSRYFKVAHRRYVREFGCGRTCSYHPPGNYHNLKT